MRSTCPKGRAHRAVIVRAADNAVALDLDGDGRESTGWVLLCYPLAASGVTG